ncbi:lamin tail domain-containing protein [Fuerstiella marisgermanici]|nr:lamin tail domain-containing protein [Fuerstiella marisgermanici]
MLSVSNFVINEIFAHPPDSVAGDANRDGTSDAAIDEFVQIVNHGATAEDKSGWTISDGVSVRHTLPAAAVIPAGQAIVKFEGVRIMGVKLTGRPDSRHLRVQPAVFSDSHVLRGDFSVNVDSILNQPVPVKMHG